MSSCVLHAESTRLPATTSPLELAALRADERLLVPVRTKAKVLHGLAAVLRATEEDRVAAGRGTHGELVKRQALTTSSLNASTSSVSEAERSNAELGEVKHTVVVGDGADDDHGLRGSGIVLGHTTLVARQVHHARDRHRRAVDLRHEQATKDHLVEARVRTARQKAVELHQQEQVRVLALGRRAATIFDVVLLDVNTLAAPLVSCPAPMGIASYIPS